MGTFLTISRELFEQGKSVRFEARGWSMRPLIRNGDFITASPVDSTSIKVGDIVFYIAGNNRVLVHRIIGLRRNNGEMIVLIKGDACFGLLDKVDSRNVLGKVVAIERNGRKKTLDTAWQRLLSLIFVAVSPLTLWGALILIRGKRILLRGR